MSKYSLSVVLATRNEELNLKRCLEAVADIADEIIIVDEQSTDRTVEIAKHFKAKIIEVEHQLNFHINKNIAIDKAKCDWILQLDADEVVSPQLKSEIVQVLEHGSEFNGYWVNRKNWFLTKFLEKGGQYPDPTLRFYKRGFGRLPAKDVHEQAVVKGSVGKFTADLLHYRDISFEKYLGGFNRYSSFIASQLVDKKTKGFFAFINYCLVKPVVIFLKIFIRHRGYVDGFAGFIFALFSGLIYPVAFIKSLYSLK